jgi:hypothetical protein
MRARSKIQIKQVQSSHNALLKFVIPNRAESPVRNLLSISIAGEPLDERYLGSDAPSSLSYMTRTVAGFEPATFGA